MELATGAMGSLLPKLDGLLAEEYNLQKGLREGLMSLRKEMASMEAALVKLAEVPSDELDKQVRLWAGEVRELSYVMEDSIDRFMVSSLWDDSGPDSLNSNKFKGLTKKMAALFVKGKARHEMAYAIKSIKQRVQEVSDRHARYNVDNAVATTTVDDPDLLAISNDHRELIGVQEEVDEIMRVLEDGGDNQHRLKVLSICGLAGLGKTTLAKAVYERMRTQTQFDCAAIVSVGQNADLKKVFKDILLQIVREQYSVFSAAELDETQYIEAIRGLLADKRYFIIINDIWDLQSWEIISCALTSNTIGSITITTTRIYEVAKRAGVVYHQKPLSPAKSTELFCAILSARKVKLPDDQTRELVDKFLHRCGGVPLAITAIATLLSNKPKEDWNEMYSSINFGATDDIAFQNTRKVIMFSYYDLPIHLRACLLHMTIFPEDYMVRKDVLIWMWVAEGFIRVESGVGLFEIGERYFNELINRSLIQPVKISHSGGIIGCRVHDMILGMICSIAQEDNFVTILNRNEQQHTPMKFIARRLALHKEFVGEQCLQANIDMSRVRSFNAFMCHTTMIPSLVSFQVLRVLAIEDCSFQPEGNAYSLEHIGELLHLRYLGLQKTPVRELPKSVGKLKYLEVLDLRKTGIPELPKSVWLLRRLKCLRADGGSTKVPDWIGTLTSLEELSLNDISSCPNFVKEVSKLTGLRDLKVWIRWLEERSKKALVKSLGNLQKIQVLNLDGGLWMEDAEWEGYVPPRQLRCLSLRTKSSRLPRWIKDSFIPNLSHLSVDVRVVEVEDLTILGSFPELTTLELFVPNSVSLLFEGHPGSAFPKLRHCYTSGMLGFLQGAAPQLESVYFNVRLSALNGASFGFLGNLPLLMEVRVEIFHSDVEVYRANEVEESLKLAVEVHGNRPTLHVSKFELSLNEDAEEEEDKLEEEDEEDWYSPTAKAT